MNRKTLNGMYTNLVVPEGINLRSDFRLGAVTLSAALSQTVAFLRSIGEDDLRLFRYDDWWEHDGLHLPRRDELIDFDVLARLVETPGAMAAAMTGDYKVFVGVAPPSFQWYLRFYHDTENSGSRGIGKAMSGCFDLTLPEGSVDAYRQQVVLPLGLQMQEQESNAYYLSIGMGSYPYSESELQKMREDAQVPLQRLMSVISQRCCNAVWADGTEIILWQAVNDGPKNWGQDNITAKDASELKLLSQKTGGWIARTEGAEETFLPMKQWLEVYSAHQSDFS